MWYNWKKSTFQHMSKNVKNGNYKLKLKHVCKTRWRSEVYQQRQPSIGHHPGPKIHPFLLWHSSSKVHWYELAISSFEYSSKASNAYIISISEYIFRYKYIWYISVDGFNKYVYISLQLQLFIWSHTILCSLLLFWIQN